MSTSQAVPRLAWAGSTYAIAIAFCRVGENVPLVTVPTGLPSARTAAPSRAMRLPVNSKPTRGRRNRFPAVFAGVSGAAPDTQLTWLGHGRGRKIIAQVQGRRCNCLYDLVCLRPLQRDHAPGRRFVHNLDVKGALVCRDPLQN